MNKIIGRTMLAMLVLTAVFTFAAAPSHAETYTAGSGFLTPQGGVFGTFQDRVHTIWTYGLSGGYFVADGFSIGAEALGYHVTQDRYKKTFNASNYDADGFGTNFLARWYPWYSDKAAFYIGTGIGGLFMDRATPSLSTGGNKSQWTLPADLGFNLHLNNSLSLNLNGRYERIGFEQHGIDSIGGNVGLRFAF